TVLLRWNMPCTASCINENIVLFSKPKVAAAARNNSGEVACDTSHRHTLHIAMTPAMTKMFVDGARSVLCNAANVILISCLFSPDATDQETSHKANDGSSGGDPLPERGSSGEERVVADVRREMNCGKFPFPRCLLKRCSPSQRHIERQTAANVEMRI